MRYDSLLAYTDECSPPYISYRLPAELVANPVKTAGTTSGENKKQYTHIDPMSWTVLKNGDTGIIVEPIAYTK